MDQEKIELILNNLTSYLEQEVKEVSAAAILPVLSCQLLLKIAQRLDHIEDVLLRMEEKR